MRESIFYEEEEEEEEVVMQKSATKNFKNKACDHFYTEFYLSSSSAIRCSNKAFTLSFNTVFSSFCL